MIGIEAINLGSMTETCKRLGVIANNGTAPFGASRRTILKTPGNAQLFVQVSAALQG